MYYILADIIQRVKILVCSSWHRALIPYLGLPIWREQLHRKLCDRRNTPSACFLFPENLPVARYEQGDKTS